ncbi:hypothetical protein [Orgyia leucostigma nucleopolyhedrovirus]|uniref:P33 n=1 Tax=Orgyia leucostigma nucleopolyhedrovirus TaxID=490711 RepID=B0FDU8_9ABAC|nr:hypothetical protein [Orgyia leucostigma nucleopolyhedrovirus]ABY65806.1 hypothetical protein [Orgyia leucostigma nucleopolyhedrovirus]
MISSTPLFTQYKDSFLLYTFRHMERMLTCKSQSLTAILAAELTYMYNIASVITYKDVHDSEIEKLKEWALNLNQPTQMEQLIVEFEKKMIELNLRALIPKKYEYSYQTIWESIHFMAIIADDIVHNRKKLTFEFVTNQLRQIKTFYHNLFIKLHCVVCSTHYHNIKGVIIITIERLEICLNRERFGETIITVDDITSNNTTENVIMKYGVLYSTMVLHNHINEYKNIQLNIKPAVDAFKMKWNEYKQLLQLN